MRAEVTKTAEMLATEQQQLLNQLSNTSDIKLRRLLDITHQLGQTSLTLPLAKWQTDKKPATTTTEEQRSMPIHELTALSARYPVNLITSCRGRADVDFVGVSSHIRLVHRADI